MVIAIGQKVTMTRQWRIGYEGALYHVLSRGNEGRAIAADDNDREVFVELLGRMCRRFDIELYAYVLMNNHFHLLVKTPRGNLSKSMQWFIGTYTRYLVISKAEPASILTVYDKVVGYTGRKTREKEASHDRVHNKN